MTSGATVVSTCQAEGQPSWAASLLVCEGPAGKLCRQQYWQWHGPECAWLPIQFTVCLAL